jgi:hypothetical protein
MTLPSPAAPPPTQPTRFLKWHRRVLAVCLIVFAFELGLFLLVFPWLRSWEISWIPVHSPHLTRLWVSHYFRGAISGLGLLNIYIALVEAAKQLKSMFSEQRT